jgi:hypothetical protein
MDRARLSPGNCPCLSSGQTRLLQPGRPLERRPAPGMELGTVSARELGCSGSRAGCSDAKPIARGTRATTEERNRFYAIDNCVCPLPVVAAVPAALMETAAGNRRSLFAGGTPATTVSFLRPLTATSSVKLSLTLRLKSLPPPPEMERLLPRASRSSTRLQK